MKAQNKVQVQQSYVSDEELTCPHTPGSFVAKWWCKSVNPRVRYAYDAVLHPDPLNSGERIILPALAFGGIPKEKIETAASQHI